MVNVVDGGKGVMKYAHTSQGTSTMFGFVPFPISCCAINA